MFAGTLKKLGVITSFVLLFGLPAVSQAQQFETKIVPPPTYAEVVVDTLNVRGAASKDGPMLAQLKKGDLVPVKKVKDGWVQLAWSGKAFVFENGVSIPEGTINKKPMYERMRDAFLTRIKELDPTIQWVEVPRQTGISVRYHWREYRDRAALIARTEELARIYSTMSTGEKGITVDIISGAEVWGKAFY